jgi:hypothetical protein
MAFVKTMQNAFHVSGIEWGVAVLSLSGGIFTSASIQVAVSRIMTRDIGQQKAEIYLRRHTVPDWCCGSHSEHDDWLRLSSSCSGSKILSRKRISCGETIMDDGIGRSYSLLGSEDTKCDHLETTLPQTAQSNSSGGINQEMPANHPGLAPFCEGKIIIF